MNKITYVPIANDISKCIFLKETVCILILMLLKFVQWAKVDIKSSLVQVVAWRRAGAKPLPEPMMTPKFTDAYMCHQAYVC